MLSNKVVNFIGKLVDNPDPEITIKLDRIIYSYKHGHEICIMQLIGKNAFPKLTTTEILSDPKAMKGLSTDDIVTITRLDEKIKQRKNMLHILEIDVNGTILLEDHRGKIKRYSEKNISQNRELLNQLSGADAHDVGYRVGFKDGLSVASVKNTAINILNEAGLNFISKKFNSSQNVAKENNDH